MPAVYSCNNHFLNIVAAGQLESKGAIRLSNLLPAIFSAGLLAYLCLIRKFLKDFEIIEIPISFV